MTIKPKSSEIAAALRLATLIACGWAALISYGWAAPAAGANNDIAVIIGNANYGKDIPDIAYAGRDADAIRAYLIGVRGFQPDNIIDIRDATKAQMEATFGNANNPKGRLWRYSDPADGGSVFVYYSGHGIPGLSDRKRYLLPVDTEPDFADVSGYPVEQLLANLSAYRSATVIIDACFSGGSAGGTLFPSSSGIQISAKHETPPQSLTVLTAAGPGQLASWDHRSQHGLFTEFFLRGAYGEADLNLDGQILASEMKAFLDANMTKVARRTYGREQEASLLGQADRVLAAFQPWNKPSRPRIESAPYRDKPVAIARPAPTTPPTAPPTTPPDWNPPGQPTSQPAPPPASQPPPESTANLVLRTIIKGLEVYRDIMEMKLRTVARQQARVRFKPGRSARELGWIRRGQAVEVTGRVQGSNWLRINYGGRPGYLRASDLAKLQPGEYDRWQRALASRGKNDFRKYLRLHPRGYFAPRARARLGKRLKQ